MVQGVRTAVVIDDDPDARLILEVALGASGFRVHEAATGAEGVDRVRDLDPDLVTLDLEMPGISGSETLRRIRAISDAYVIMISATADETDRLLGLAAGADDFVTKPFSPREVQARVSAMFRRPRALREEVMTSLPAPRTPELIETDVLRHGPLVIDLEGRAAWLLEAELQLTRTEFDLLATLAGNPRKVWRRLVLLDEVWGDQHNEQHVVEVHMGNLRRKLGEAVAGGSRMIVTVRGIGYRLAPVHTLPPSLGTSPEDELSHSLNSRIGEFSGGRW
jgi:two-component system OmpR family response regulator